MSDIVREERPLGGSFARRRISWTAIWGGIVATLGVLILMLFLGSALGLTVFDPFKGPFYETAMSWATLAWAAFSVVVASFFGAWVSGHWANVQESEDAFIHGVLTWALGLVLVTVGLGTLGQFPGPAIESGAAGAAGLPAAGLSYSSLDDQRFADFLVNRANSYAASQPIPVTAEPETEKPEAPAKPAVEKQAGKDLPVLPRDLATRNEWLTYVTANTNLNETQAKEFLKTEKDAIATAHEDSVKRWEQEHSRELAQGERMHTTALALSWTVFGLSVLALVFAVAGSLLGFNQRSYEELSEEIAGVGDGQEPL